jgi:uncharacterized protein YjbJ (UPF0337 family)
VDIVIGGIAAKALPVAHQQHTAARFSDWRNSNRPRDLIRWKKHLAEGNMDWTMIERMWRQAKGRIQSKWDKLTNEDLELIAGRRERLEAKIRHLYGFSPEHVSKEVDDWLRWQVVFGPRGQRQLGRSALASIR